MTKYVFFNACSTFLAGQHVPAILLHGPNYIENNDAIQGYILYDAGFTERYNIGISLRKHFPASGPKLLVRSLRKGHAETSEAFHKRANNCFKKYSEWLVEFEESNRSMEEK